MLLTFRAKKSPGPVSVLDPVLPEPASVRVSVVIAIVTVLISLATVSIVPTLYGTAAFAGIV